MSKFYLQLEEEISTGENTEFNDEELVEKSLENPRLFELFVEKYQDSFLRTATRILKGREESEDVVQDAFVKIYFNAGKFQKRPGIKFKSWAFKILINCVFTRYRKMKRNLGDTEYIDELLYIIEDRSFSADFGRKEKKDEIESVLQKMPEDLSGLMREHYLEDRPYAEISSDKNMSIPALKMKLFRARKKFKEVWKTN
ncbi:sigma-70 family RNA polymerase sigma factor [Patescibacteria group bacterium]|nr:sigma-70 family RNA polymerase sigma factor [Patescibacteria group bacterium]